MANDEKPLVTFALFAYNQEKYIREAVEGALAQDYRPLEIIISDDCSTDRTFEVAQQAVANAGEDVSVRVRRNAKNLGLLDHFQLVVEIAQGEIIIVAAGDDVSLADRATRCVDAFNREPAVSAISMGLQTITEAGRPIRTRKKAFESGLYTWERYRRGGLVPIMGASRAYRRQLILGSRMSGALRSEDNVLVARALLLDGCVFHISDVGVLYRISPNTQSSTLDLRSWVGTYRQKVRDVRRNLASGAVTPGKAKEALILYRKQLSRNMTFASALSGSRLRAIGMAIGSPQLVFSERVLLVRKAVASLIRRMGVH